MHILAFRTGFAGVAFSLACLALVAPASAATPAMMEAWKACTGPSIPAETRIAKCSEVIASGELKGAAALSMAFTGRGFARAMRRDFDGALADLNEAIKQMPAPTALYYRALVFDQTDQLDRALGDLNKAIEIDPKNGSYYRARSSIFSKRKDYARAIADVSTALGLSSRPQVEYSLRGILHEEAGEKDKAIADYQKVLEIDPDDEFVRRQLGHLGGQLPQSAALPEGLCSANNITHEERVAGCTAVIESGNATGWTLKAAYCNRGYALTEMKEYDRVITDSDAALRVDDKLACAYLNRARGWYYKHDLDRAIADYTQAIKFDGRFHEAYASRGTAYFDRRDFTRAIADYDAAIAIDSTVAMYFSDRGNTRYLMGEHQRAVADLTVALSLEPGEAKIYIRRGYALLETGEFDRAAADFDKALELQPDDAYTQRGRTLAIAHKTPAQAAAENNESKDLSFSQFQRRLGPPAGTVH